ncbi:MAG: hypothetical protein U0835_24810 [Isosphaeraceae bacterium]
MSTGIKLRGGPCDGETHEVKDTTRRVTRSSKYPGVSYDASDEYEEASGRRIFVYRESAESRGVAL